MSIRRNDAPEDWYKDVPRSISTATLAGALVIALSIGGFGTWAATAPLAAAVVAKGTFVATGRNKMIQHLEGGIIRDIRAREGERVVEGQILMVLEDVASRANVRRLTLRLIRLQSASDRLSAFMGGERSFAFTEIAHSPDDEAEIAEIRAMQNRIFDTMWAQLDGNVALVDASLGAVGERIKGARAQKQAVAIQTDLIEKEREGKAKLAAKGLISRTQLYEIDRVRAEAHGTLGKIEGELGDLASQSARFDRQILQIRQDARQQASDELQAVNSELDDIREQLAAADDVLGRVEIRSPVNGVLVKLNYHTRGGVIEAGKDIMEILPENEDLVIEAPVRPADIDDVAMGQVATVHLTSFNQRTTPVFTGTVTYVSADTLRDDRRNGTDDIYLVRVLLDDKHLEEAKTLNITPGMPADIFVETAERTFIDYLSKPVRDSMNRAFRER